jgi:hypothetical protein
LVRRRLPEGLEGISRLHALIAASMPPEWADLDDAEAASRVKVGIETERGPWVTALVAAGYEVFAIDPKKTAEYTLSVPRPTSGKPVEPQRGRAGCIATLGRHATGARRGRPHRALGRSGLICLRHAPPARETTEPGRHGWSSVRAVPRDQLQQLPPRRMRVALVGLLAAGEHHRDRRPAVITIGDAQLRPSAARRASTSMSDLTLHAGSPNRLAPHAVPSSRCPHQR